MSQKQFKLTKIFGSLSYQNKMDFKEIEIIYLTGHHACGKTELGRRLSLTMKIPIIETGAMVRDCYSKRMTSLKELSIGDYVRETENKNSAYFTIILKNQILELISKNTENNKVLVIGMRSLKNIIDLKKMIPEWKSIIIWIDVTSKDLLRKRYNHREDKNLTNSQFEKLLAIDESLGIQELKIAANYRLCNEEGVSIENLLNQGLIALNFKSS